MRNFLYAAAAIALISLLAHCPLGAADAAPATEQPATKADATTTAATGDATPKTLELFDGKTLENWKSSEFGGDGELKVEDGLLTLGVGSPLSGVTWKGKELPTVNYELTLEARRNAGSDFFCALTFPVQKTHATLVLGGWGGSLTGISSINHQDASENETTDFYSFEDATWYKVRVRVTDKRIQAWLNDTSLADVEYADKKIGLRFEMELSKPLGLATYHTAASYRAIKLRPLSTEEVKTTNAGDEVPLDAPAE